MIDDTLIRLPEKNLSQALRIAHKIISDDNFKKNRVIDLRISNHIITHKWTTKILKYISILEHLKSEP